MEERKLLTDHDVAKMLNVARGTVQDWRVRGIGPPYRKMGTGAVRYLEDEVWAWATGEKTPEPVEAEE